MITHTDWQAISRFIGEQIASLGQNFLQAKVVKRDNVKKLVWVKELGDQPIPLVAFDFTARYYIVDANNNTVPRTTSEIEIVAPKIGEIVLIALYSGSRRLPKCLGVIQSTDYVGKG